MAEALRGAGVSLEQPATQSAAAPPTTAVVGPEELRWLTVAMVNAGVRFHVTSSIKAAEDAWAAPPIDDGGDGFLHARGPDGARGSAGSLQPERQPRSDELHPVRRRGDTLVETALLVPEPAGERLHRHEAEADLVGDKDQRRACGAKRCE